MATAKNLMEKLNGFSRQSNPIYLALVVILQQQPPPPMLLPSDHRQYLQQLQNLYLKMKVVVVAAATIVVPFSPVAHPLKNLITNLLQHLIPT